MKVATTLSVFGLGLAVVLASAAALGDAVGPVASTEQKPEQHNAMADDGHDAAAGHDTGQVATAPAGLAVEDAGWTLRPTDSTLNRGLQVPFSFSITGPGGAPETSYVESHTKDLHLIVVRRDLSTFQHLHPTRNADGLWSVPLTIETAGSYRVPADFRPAGLGRQLTLGADVQVPGDFTPVDLPAPQSTATTTGGYTVTLGGTPVAGREAELVLTVSRAGSPVTDLQPYLGAYGHLVALRVADLAYLHTHPDGRAGGDTDSPAMTFGATFPSAGSYRLFLDFRVGGAVRTAAFTVEVGDG